jgi:hypothetical protein
VSTFPRTPRVLRGGLVLLNPTTAAVIRTIVLQYNPDTLTRTLQVQGTGAQSGDRLEALRLKGPPAESIKLDAEIDASDQLEHPGEHPTEVEFGIHAQLASLETIVYPAAARAQVNDTLAAAGTLEIAPVEAPLTLFVWSAVRVLPVRLTEFSITEEAFDPALNPIRAKVSLGMHVLSINDLPFTHRGASIFMAYHRRKEQLAARAGTGSIGALGIKGIP